MDLREVFLNNNCYLYDEVINNNKILDDLKNLIINISKNLDDDYEEISKDVFVHKSVEIDRTATIVGPTIIGKNTVLRPGAYIRGNVIIGENVVLGHSSEVKNSIIFDNVKLPHFNYVGDSVIGYNVEVGAGVIISNYRLNEKNVIIKELEMERKKIGAFIGDNVCIGCNSVINPGTIIYPNTIIKPLASVKGIIDTTNK